MEDWKLYFKMPLTYTEGYPCFVFDSDNNRAFDFLFDGDEDQVKVVRVLNGEIKDSMNVEFSHEDGTVYYNAQPFLMVRSWGRLTGIGGGLGLPPEKAAKIQDEFCDWIINTLKNKP